MPTAEVAPSTSDASPRDSTELTEAKRRLRASARERRAAVVAAAPPDAADRLVQRFLRTFPLAPGTVVSGYMPIGDELDPRPLLLALAASGCHLALPVVVGRGRALTFRAWRPGDALVARPMGLSEPRPDAPAAEPDVLLVPLLAFDAGGRRIGYGAGYYDMTIAGLRARRRVLAVGIAFEGQRVDRVPAGPWDAVLDAVVTELATHRVPPVPV